MKKFLLILALFSLSACTTADNKMLNENTANQASGKQASNLQLDTLKNVKKEQNSINNKSQQEKSSPEGNNLINKKTKNMNTAIIKTNKGEITIELNEEKAPISVENFKKYVDSSFYKGTIFHRVMPGFMIQGGGFDETGQQKTTEAPIKNEATNGLKNDRGTLAMARTNVVDSATSQFFINLVDNDFLNYKNDANYGYAVFAKVIDGMDVVDEIAKVETGQNGPHRDWPKENVVIESIELIK